MHLKRSAAVGLCALSLALCVPSRAVIQNGTLLHFEAMNNASFATCQGSRAEFCVRTCCEKGENVISRKCAPSSTDWAPTFLNQTTTANLEIIGGFIQECKFGYQLKTLSFHIDESTKYLLSSSGELEVQTAENTFALGFNYCFFNLEVNDQILESVRSCVKISVPQVAGLPSIDSVPSVSVRKCCPPDQMMGVSKDALVCVNRSSPWRPAVIHSYPTQLAQLPAEKTNISDPGKFKCPNGTSMQFLIPSASKDAFFLMSNGNILLARYNLSIKPGLFCLDDLRNPTSAPQPFATVCHTMPKQRTPKQLEAHCTDEVCVQKCCAAGFRLHNSQCVPTTLRWKPTFYEGERLFRGQVAHKVLYGQINCDDGEIHVFNGSRSATPLLQKNGGLRVNGTVYTFGVHRCCIDSGSIQNLPASLNSPGHTLAFCCQPHDKEAELMEIVKKILLIMSSICLFVMLAIYMLVPCLRNIHGKCLMSHAAALFAAFFFTVYNQIVPVEEGPSCDALGFGAYFSFNAALFWLNVMSFDIWWTFAHLRAQPPSERSLRHRFIRHSLYAWGVPLVMTGLLAFFNYAPTSVIPDGTIVRPGIGEGRCFFASHKAGLLYFYITIFIITGVNVVFFLATAWKLYKADQDSRILQRKRTARDRLRVYVNLFIIMEVSWIAECLSELIPPKQIWYFTDILNASQGIVIFFLFIVRSSSRRAIKDRYLELTKRGFNPSAGLIHPPGKDERKPPSSRTKTTGASSSGTDGNAQSSNIHMTDVQKGDNIKTAESNGDSGKATPCNPDKSTHDNPC